MIAKYDRIVRLMQFTIPIGLLYCTFWGLENSLDYIWISIIVNLLSNIFATTGHVACLLRFYAGWFVGDIRKRPLRPLILFDRELDPKCMPVRECLSIFDCTVEIYPVPMVDDNMTMVDLPVAPRFANELVKRSPSKSQVLPYLEDPNTQIVLQGNTDDILLYMYTTYARRGAHRTMQPPLDKGKTGLRLASLACKARFIGNPYGYYAQPSAYNRLPFKLYAYEGCPYSRSVREMLCSLQLHYQLVTCAQGSTGRVQLVHQIGELVTPVLYDPETKQLCEGEDECVAYLKRWYDLSAMLTECNMILNETSLEESEAGGVDAEKVHDGVKERIDDGLPKESSPVNGTPTSSSSSQAYSSSFRKFITPKTIHEGDDDNDDGIDAVSSNAGDERSVQAGPSNLGKVASFDVLPITAKALDGSGVAEEGSDDEDGERVQALLPSASFIQRPLYAPATLTRSASASEQMVAQLRMKVNDAGGSEGGLTRNDTFSIPPKVNGSNKVNDVSKKLLELSSK